MRDILKDRIFKSLNHIEIKTGTMAHEIKDIKESLRRWQDGKIKDLYFLETLNKHIDLLEVTR